MPFLVEDGQAHLQQEQKFTLMVLLSNPSPSVWEAGRPDLLVVKSTNRHFQGESLGAPLAVAVCSLISVLHGFIRKLSSTIKVI